jgi:hypothetical protein
MKQIRRRFLQTIAAGGPMLGIIPAMATPEQRPAVNLARFTWASRRYSEVLPIIVVSHPVMSSALEIPKVSDALKDYVLSEYAAGSSDLRSILEMRARMRASGLRSGFRVFVGGAAVGVQWAIPRAHLAQR